MGTMNRRLFLLGGMGAVAGAAVPSWALADTGTAAPAIANPFRLGVASGDPLPDSVVLWTRLAPSPLAADGYGGMPNANYQVDWELASDEKFAHPVRKGSVTATRAGAHSVHVEPTGLDAGREYFYRFRTAGYLSPVGRTRTAPAASTAVPQLKFCFSTCQHWEEGWYHAYRGMVADAPDLVLFMGDYIYEKPSKLPAGHRVRKVAVTAEAATLATYRNRYAQHHTDGYLQQAHAMAPWIAVFDDHEVKNNWNRGTPGNARKAAGFQAFYENMPIRSTARPHGASIQLYRQLQWGNLARFHMLDTRQYRDPQAAKGNCGQMRDPHRTLTGPAEEQWLLKAFEQHPATWDFLGQQVFFAQRDSDGRSNTCGNEDSWDGYQACRQRITQGWVDRKVPNPIVLTGDVHRHWAADLRVNYWDHKSPIVGSELVTTSVTSHNSAAAPGKKFYDDNPHIRYCRNKRGYVRVTNTPQQLRADFVTVSNALEKDPGKVTVGTDRSFVVAAGSRGLHPA